tara:strand:+ start:250 stop:537 length:288 start_codon:yes stop_codon:yes gene_type:complete
MAEQAETYIQQKEVQAVLEEVVRDLLVERPEDAFGYLAKLLEKRANKTITKVHAREIIDSRGNPTVEVCTVNRHIDYNYFPIRRTIFNFLKHLST